MAEELDPQQQQPQLEDLRSQADMGLGGLIGFMVAANVAPMMAKSAARGAVRRLGRLATRQSAAVARAEAHVLRSSAADPAEALRQRIRRGQVGEQSLMSRIGQAAAFEARQASGVDLSRFADTIGLGTPMRLRQRAAAWEEFRQSHDRKTDRLRAFFASSEKRKLLGSIAARLAHQQMVEMPVMYGLDTYLGITGGPAEAPAIHDPVGHARSFISWLPQYAASEAAGRVLFASPRLLAEQASRLDGALRRAPRAAQAFSDAYSQATSALDEMRDAARSAANLYRTARVAGTFEGKAAQTMTAGRAFFKDLRRLRKQRREMTPQERALRISVEGARSDRGLRSAQRVFGGDNWTEMRRMMQRLRPKGDRTYERIFKNLFVLERKGPGAFARLFGGEAVTIGEVRGHIARLESKLSGGAARGPLARQLADMKRELARAEKGAADFYEQVLKDPMVDEQVKQFTREHLRPDRLRMSGFTRIGGRIMRAPSGADLRSRIGQAAVRATAAGRKFSLARLFQVHTLTSDRLDTERITGKFALDRDAYFFGRSDRLPERIKQHDWGFFVANQPGSLRGSIFGFHEGNVIEIGRDKLLLSALGNSKMHSIAMRMAGMRSESNKSKEALDRERGRFGWLHRRLRGLEIGTGTHRTMLSVAKDLFSIANPRRLFSSESPLFRYSNMTRVEDAGNTIAHALSAIRKAQISSSDVYLRGDIMDDDFFARRLGFGRRLMHRLGGSEAILRDDRVAAEAARHVLKGVAKIDDKGIAPSAANARKILNEIDRGGIDALYNATGEPRGEILRRFLFEQGVLGHPQAHLGAAKEIARVDRIIEELAASRAISADAAAQARAGLLGLRLRSDGVNVEDPYQAAADLRGRLLDGTPLGDAAALLQRHEYRSVLEAFGRTRPHVDPVYHPKAYRLASEFGTGGVEADVMAVTPRLLTERYGGLGPLLFEFGIDTTREAFGYLGLGWRGDTAGTDGSYMDQLKASLGTRTWMRRAGVLAAGVLAYRAADTALDVLLPDSAPLGDGLTGGLSDLAAGARRTAATVREALGITGAYQYLEGLMPRSAAMIPGAIAGAYLSRGRRLRGAVLGAAINRMTVEAFRDTPFEALAIVPGLSPFFADPTQSAEQVEAYYTGEDWVPVRKGRGFLLSTSDFAGGRVSGYRPNWYTRVKADIGSTDVMYGSDVNEFLYKPLPLIDFAIGDLWAPQFLQEKHYFDRPYFTPRVPFSDVPVLGPVLGNTLGRLYATLHPNATTRPLHMEEIVATFDGEPLPGALRPQLGRYSAAVVSVGGGLQALGSLDRAGTVVVGGSSSRAVFDEQFYRLTEAMGFQGFLIQSAVGGEGVFRNPILPSASEMSSTARAIHDENLGDLLGVGEALRRAYPFQRRVERVGPVNMTPDWLPERFHFGDPYCLLPETLIEIDGHLMEAAEAHARLERGERLWARTHKGRMKPIVASAERPVDEEVVRLTVEGLPWPLELTKGHPVLVWESGESAVWRLAGEVREGDTVLLPAGPYHEEVALKDYRPGKTKNYRWRLPHNGVTADGIGALTQLEPGPTRKVMMTGLSDLDRFRIERAFSLSPSKHRQRDQATVASLRREMAEHGLPLSIIGMSAQTLRPLVARWGTLEGDAVVVRLDEQALGLGLSGTRRRPYVASRDARDAVRDAAYTFWRALLSARVPAALERDGDAYVLRLTGASSARYLARRTGATRETRSIVPARLRVGRQRFSFGKARVARVETIAYRGAVYAFQVEGDESFVVAGVATHNSKIAKGEFLLPGAGYDKVRRTGLMEEYDLSDLGATAYETSLRMLDVISDEPSGKRSWAKEYAAQMLIDAGYAARREAVYVDERTRLVATADVSTLGNSPVLIEVLSEAEFRQTRGMRERDRERVNALIGAARRSKGALVYVNEDTGEVQAFMQQFDSGLYNESLRKLEEGRSLAMRYYAEGYGAPGSLYSTIDRLQVLLNADPFSPEFRREMRKGEALAAAGVFDPSEQRYFDKIRKQREVMALPFEIFPRRFSGAQLLDPDPAYMMLNFNEHVKAAAAYSLPERIVGGAWERFTNIRSPLHTKFFGAYDLPGQYERMVLLGRDFQSWNHPVRDFVRPYLHGLAAADDPIQGAASYGLGASLFLGGPWGAIGGTLGALYGAAHGLYREVTDTHYVPGTVEDVRVAEQAFDRLSYYRARGLYQATGSREYLDQMARTAYGLYISGLPESGYAKARRPDYSPAAQFDDGLFGSDLGFGSPWRGIKSLASHRAGLLKSKRQSSLIKVLRDYHKEASSAERAISGIDKEFIRQVRTMKGVRSREAKRVLGYGYDSVAVELEGGLVMKLDKIGRGGLRPDYGKRPFDIPLVERGRGYHVQPKAEPVSPLEYAMMKQIIKQQGFDFHDAGMSQLGRWRGRPYLIDYGAVRSLPAEGLSMGTMARHVRHAMGPAAYGAPDRGFGSPWQGQDPERSLLYDPNNPFPQQMTLPPELLPMFAAVPHMDRPFLRAAFAVRNLSEQEEFLRMVSPDTAALLDTGWQFLYGQEGRGLVLDPMEHLDLGLAHEAMGLGADLEAYQIRTMEDLHLDTHDAGIGWKDAQVRMQSALSPTRSLAAEIRAGASRQEAISASELKAIIKNALYQMGIVADVDVQASGGPTEIQFIQRL